MRRFAASRAALTLITHPKLGFLDGTMSNCALSVAADVVGGLQGVLCDVSSGGYPSPGVMEQCQEAMSCCYYLLQKFPQRFSHEEGGWSFFADMIRVIVEVLRSAAFSRDCLVAAGVSFWAALLVCWSQEELSCFISQGFFGFFHDDCGGEWSMGRKLCGIDMCCDVESMPTLSRLCLIRGMLTTVPRQLLNRHLHYSSVKMAWTILFDGILHELCSYCENPIDSHFNFHTLTVMQICFQQIKTSILSGMIDQSEGYDPVPDLITSRLLKIIWNNLEDPLSQTVKQVHLIFDLFLDVQTSFLSGGENHERVRIFLCRIASNLLCLGPRCKGRYIPLAFLTKRLGAKKLLDMHPKLLFETAHAYVDDDVCCAVTSFLKCYLELLRDECWRDDGIENGYENFRGFCLPPLLQGLVSGKSKLRSNLNTYALPVILEIDVDSIFPMLAFISVGPKREVIKMSDVDITVDQCVAALVSLLKVARLIALIEGDIVLNENSSFNKDIVNGLAVISIKGIHVELSVKWLVLALTHADEHIRIDAAESLFLNPKTSTLPSSLELQLLRIAVPLNMRCCSTAFQMKWTSLFRKFFSRVKTALERQVKQGNWQLNKLPGHVQVGAVGDSKDVVSERASELFSFVKWLTSHLFFSCYPSAPYERKTMAMSLILILLDVWPLEPPVGDNKGIYPYNNGFVSGDSTLLLIGSIIDSWDRLRESSYSILSRFPTPLPGISSCDAVKDVIKWAKKLVCSPRVRESDAGALALRLIFKKYVVELGWFIGISIEIKCWNPQDKLQLQSGEFIVAEFKMQVVEYLFSLVEWLGIAIEEGEKDLPKACKSSFVHGILLALRYTFEELDWNSAETLSNSIQMKSVLEKLLDLITRISSLALWVVSADAWYLPTDDNDALCDIDILDDANYEDIMDHSLEVVNGMKHAEKVGPASQVVMVGCWLAMKEVSLLLGTIVRKIPLPGCTYLNSTDEVKNSLVETNGLHGPFTSDAILNITQLERIGSHFLQVLLKMKHNGAVDKTRAGFTALCNRLLSSNDPRLCKMTESWLEQLMERTTAKGQTVDDLLRRSAGIPAAFMALFLSEPEGTPKKLLPQALRWLIDVVGMSFPTFAKQSHNGAILLESSLESLNKEAERFYVVSPTCGRISKIRDEGVVPTVHAFNVLRAAFNDTNLATDTSGFAAEALIISIRAFSSSYWEVRNSTCLAYTALIRRMIGFLNVHKRESARRALTGVELFHRYPSLFPFLYNELKIATESLPDERCKHQESDVAKAIHPSLCPILILLSRLKPSLANNDPNEKFDPFLLLPFVSRCAVQSNLRVRMLASRALTGLVSNERLLNVVTTIANSLPHQRRKAQLHLNGGFSYCSHDGNCGKDSASNFISSYNSIHGVLLQLSTLVNSNFRNLTETSKKEEIFNILIPILTKCSWLGSIRLCTCPTLNSLFLCILDHLLDIARMCELETHIVCLQKLLEELSSQYLDDHFEAQNMFDPTKVELKKQAASSYWSCLFGGNSGGCLFKLPGIEITQSQFQEMFMFCLHDSAYEVRLATLKQLMKFLKSVDCANAVGTPYFWVKTSLQTTLMRLLDVEDNFKCIYHILRIISTWNLLQFEKHDCLQDKDMVYIGNLDCSSLFDFWNKLTRLSSTATHRKIHEALLRCMGICVRQFILCLQKSIFMDSFQVEEITCETSAHMNHGLDGIFGYINKFVSLVKQHGASSEPVNMRRAAAESIISSGLLKEVNFLSLHISNCDISSYLEDSGEASLPKFHVLSPSRRVNTYAKKVLEAWSVCINLLEDEDIGLRKKLAHDVQTCIPLTRQANCHEFAPTQVERVIELCFEFLTLAFGHWMEYLLYLAHWILDLTHHTITQKDLVRQVFDKEIDNHHEEKLLICQICCLHLEKLLSSSSWLIKVDSSGVNNLDIILLIQKLGLIFLQQLVNLGHKYREEGGAYWIGGMGNHKDAFVAIYGSLLGIYALLQYGDSISMFTGSCDLGELFSSEFEKMEVVIQPFLQNILIFNLYALLTRLHSKLSTYCRDSSLPIECSDWVDFDPYFLLQ